MVSNSECYKLGYRWKRVVASMCVLLFVATSSWACGGGEEDIKKNNDTNNTVTDPNEDRSGDPPVAVVEPAIKEFYEISRSVECDMIFRCCTQEERSREFGGMAEEGECAETRGLLPIGMELMTISNSVKEGRLEFDERMAELCIESYQKQDCSEWGESEPFDSALPGCLEAITPLLEEGHVCLFDKECITGYCGQVRVESESNNTSSENVCMRRAEKGESCASVQCGSGLYCDTFNRICVEQRIDGMSCLNDRECVSGSCVALSGGQLTCMAPLPLCLGE